MPKVLTGRPPVSEFATPVIISKIIDGKHPARLQGVRELGLTNSVLDMMVRCLHNNPGQRPTMTEVVRLAREWPVLSLPLCGINIMTCLLQL